MVIYINLMLITAVILIYNTEWQQYHGMVVKFPGKKSYNIGPWYTHKGQILVSEIFPVYSDYSVVKCYVLLVIVSHSIKIKTQL